MASTRSGPGHETSVLQASPDPCPEPTDSTVPRTRTSQHRDDTGQSCDALSLTDSTGLRPRQSPRRRYIARMPYSAKHQLTGAAFAVAACAAAAFADAVVADSAVADFAVAVAGTGFALAVLPPLERMDSVSVSTFFIIG